ncbi:MAG: hypothetical protein MJ107_01525 [Lachnospiraceae bacterium]|nr:hypothetical protein [Lachnospiraceae bacterium]
MLINNIDLDKFKNRIQESELFSRKFGTFAKSDYEILMFTIFMDSQSENIRDYDISVALGIPESKVRNLRIKSQLLYPREINWVNELNNAISHGYYDPSIGTITITIENPSVQSLLKNKVEENYGVVGLTLNNKQLVLPVESFLLLAALSEENSDYVLKELNKLLIRETKSKAQIEKKSFKNRYLKNVPDVVSFVSNAMQIYSIGKPIVQAIISIIQ